MYCFLKLLQNVVLKKCAHPTWFVVNVFHKIKLNLLYYRSCVWLLYKFKQLMHFFRRFTINIPSVQPIISTLIVLDGSSVYEQHEEVNDPFQGQSSTSLLIFREKAVGISCWRFRVLHWWCCYLDIPPPPHLLDFLSLLTKQWGCSASRCRDNAAMHSSLSTRDNMLM